MKKNQSEVKFKLRPSFGGSSKTSSSSYDGDASVTATPEGTPTSSSTAPRTPRTPKDKQMELPPTKRNSSRKSGAPVVHESIPAKKNTPRQKKEPAFQMETSEHSVDELTTMSSDIEPNTTSSNKHRLDDLTPKKGGIALKNTKKPKEAEFVEEGGDTAGPAPPPVTTPMDPVFFKLPKTPKTPTTPIAQSSSSASKPVASTRSSGRVSKPNRLYTDESFNTEILGRKTVTEQNEVLVAQARDATPEVEPSLPSTSTSSARTLAVPKKKVVPKEVVPKPVPIINGVFRGYIPSVKVPLADIEVEGVVEKLNDVVTDLMDTLLFKVCGDGLLVHENIDPAVVRAKKYAKILQTRQAKKLEIQMRHASQTSEDLGKRKRQAPKTDDFYYTPHSKSKVAVVKEFIKEEKEDSPIEEDTPRNEHKRQQAARQSISHIFDAEMDASMKEAKNSAASFEKYMRPKVETTRKRTGVTLMSFNQEIALDDDLFYQELLTEEQCSPSNSNVENEQEDNVDVDIERVDDEEVSGELISDEVAIGIRTDALDIAEQISVILPRPTAQDGSPMLLNELESRTIDQTEKRRTCLQLAVDIIMKQLSYESAPAYGDAGQQQSLWHTVTDANAKMLKNAYTISCSDRDDSITWTHQFLVENLPVHVLASYLSVLRFARKINPSRFNYIVHSTDEIDDEWSQATSLLKSFVNKRIMESTSDLVNNTVPYRCLSDTVFLLVPPAMTSGAPGAAFSTSSSHHNSSQTRPRQHGILFRWLQLIGHSNSEVISFDEESDRSCSVAELLSDGYVEKICNKVKQKNMENADCNIVLVGYGASTYLVHRASNLVPGIAAIISLGFPVSTTFGRRGTADDEILLTYSPTLFVVGAEGNSFDNVAMTQLRSSMVTPSGLVVVGNADDHLLVPVSTLLRLGISQKVVFRMITQKIIDFLCIEQVRNISKADLKPLEINNVYDMDSSLLKSEKSLSGLAYASSSAQHQTASPVGSGGRRATVSGATEDSAPKRKKQESNQSKVAPLPSVPYTPPVLFGTQSSLPPPSAAAQGRFDAFQNLVAATVATVDDMPRRASMSSSPRVIERGDFRDRAAAIAVSRPLLPPPPTVPKGPIDPATISLN